MLANAIEHDQIKAATVADTDQPRKGGDAPLSKIFKCRYRATSDAATHFHPTTTDSGK